MTAHHQARLALGVGALVSILALAFWFPLGVLAHQRGELSSLEGQLGSINQRNATLTSEISSLGQLGTIETIAHQEYGLVQPGQHSFVIEPVAGSSTGAPGLRTSTIPVGDLVADLPAVAAPKAAPAPTASFWSRFVAHLEFWNKSS